MGNDRDQNHKMLCLEHGGCTVICLGAVKSVSVGISCVFIILKAFSNNWQCEVCFVQSCSWQDCM